MKRIYKILRSIVVSLLLLTVGIPMLLYLVLWFGPVREKIKEVASTELSALLGARVEMQTLAILPVNRVELSGVTLLVETDTIMAAEALNAGISFRNLLMNRRLVITDVELMHPDIRLEKDSSGLNIQPIIDKLKGDGSTPATAFDLAIHTVVIRNGKIAGNGFLRNQNFSFTDLNADITAPRISNGLIDVRLKRFSVSEQKGLKVRRLSADIKVQDSLLSINGLHLLLNKSNLALGDMTLNLKGRHIGEVAIESGSTVCPADISPYIPQLHSLDSQVSISASADLFHDSIAINSLEVSEPSLQLELQSVGELTHSKVGISGLKLGIKGEKLSELISRFKPIDTQPPGILSSLGRIQFIGSGSWSQPGNSHLNVQLTTDLGDLSIDARLFNKRLNASVRTLGLDLAQLLPGKQLGIVEFSAQADLSRTDGSATAHIDRLDWSDLSLTEVDINGSFFEKSYHAEISVNDSLLALTSEVDIDLTPGDYALSLEAEVENLDYKGYAASAMLAANLKGPEIYLPSGVVSVQSLNVRSPQGKELKNEDVTLVADFSAENKELTLSSGFVDADIAGEFDLRSIAASVNNVLADALPQFFAPTDNERSDNAVLQATVHDSSPLPAFLNLPVELLYPAKISASLSDSVLKANVSAPYISNGNKLISNTRVDLELSKHSSAEILTNLPSKFGYLDFNISATTDRGNGSIGLKFSNKDQDVAADISARIKTLAVGADISVNPGRLTLGGVNWNVEPAFIGQRGRSTIVHGFGISRPGQELAINGVVSAQPDDRLIVKLDNINVDYIFQILRLNPALYFGGDATGTVTAAGLLSSEPTLETNNLYVRNFSYGHCTMGDASIRSRWNNDNRAIEILADIPNKATDGLTQVDGKIFPLSSNLDFLFTARHTPVGFIHTFTSTWASRVTGNASGWARLFGDFKHVDLAGDFYAEDFGLTIGFTGVTYTASDSVHIRPGVVDLSGIRVCDPEGHKAVLNGALNHRHFLDCDFNFRVDNMKDMLVLNTCPATDEDFWYGKIHANGGVEISGVPGLVKLSANVQAAAHSDFTFVLSDTKNAAEYKFLTIRDASPRIPTAQAAPGSVELDEMMRARVAKAAQLAAASNFNIDMQVDVTPDATINLIMDAKTGDKISGIGSGHIGLLYGSQTDEFKLYGDYRIDKGDYNFSLQDIILRNFQIVPGSEIAFSGDPLNARLDLSATYRVNANLTDLDETFANDKEVQRTNVPVNAVLNVRGPLQEPQISFDLDLPTLTSDVKRKVRSIVSTDEMMNRQIIYLLALDRFYTPEYMTATKGNDLMSMASGTLSSQLGNLLGQISDKVSVAPSLRTDNGDFSDMEVDVALSSTLLNNRLLLNGNFGYRDKALNSNQFIGDFDVEYLLTRKGNWRLKAYNHFNDRNLYVRTALTTQGLGLVFKHDFDNLLRKKKKPYD